MIRKLLLLAALGLASPAGAQSITGAVTDSESQAPVPGALVTVRDAAKQVKARVLTDQNGAFRLNLASGKFQLSVEHIAFQPVTRGVDVAGSGNASLRFALEPAAIALKELVVQSRNQCRSTEDASAARLWYLARTALGAATAENSKTFGLRHFTRTLDSNLKQIGEEEMDFRKATGRQTYRSVSIDSLLRYGFVQTRGGWNVYMGPDAEVLLSDAFVNAHCFGVHRDRERAGLVGLSFWPHKDRRPADIQGTLWLDEDNGKLQFVEYTFTNLPQDVEPRYAAGRVEFEQLPDRSWIVRRWYIRMPRYAWSLGRHRIAGAVDEGGEVLAISDATSAAAQPGGRVSGVVFDSISGRPVAGALVYVSGTSSRTTTSDSGRFILHDVPAGEQYVSFHAASLDALPRFNNSVRIRVSADSTSEISLAIPAVQSLLAASCSETERSDAAKSLGTSLARLGVLTGNVREAGKAVPGARVELEWSGRSGNRAWVETDARGDYAICGYPTNLPALVTVSAEGEVRQRKLLERDTLPARRLDFDLVR